MLRIKDPDILRQKVRSIEEKMRKMMDGYQYGYKWCRFETKRNRMKDLLSDRQLYLNRMFLATPGEVERFERLNQIFIKKVNDMRVRSAMLYESLRTMKRMPDFDDIYSVEGLMRLHGDTSDEECILHLPEDEYYGSDFLLAAEALNEIIPDNWRHSFCMHSIKSSDLDTEKYDPGEAFTHTMEDGQSWAESDLCHPALSHICICHPIHDICCHNLYSIPDLLRINSIHIEVAITIHNDTTQDGVRSIEPGFRS